MRLLPALLALCATIGCANRHPPTESPNNISADALMGSWRSVTPSLEFVRLSLSPMSSQAGVLAARLTFSGVERQGTGTIDGDSLVAVMTVPGLSAAPAIYVMRVRDTRTLVLRERIVTGTGLALSFVRDD